MAEPASHSGISGGKSKLLLGVAGMSITAGAVYYAYSWRKDSKRQDELNKKFESGVFPDDEVDADTKNKARILQKKAQTTGQGGVNEQHQSRGVGREIIIPKSCTSSFIGKNGAYVKKLQADTNTRITSKSTLDNGDRVYQIHGLPKDVALAEHEVMRFISLQPVFLSKEILVPNEYVGVIIGTGGETIRSIQERSKAKIKVDPTEDPEISFFAPSTAVKDSTPVLIKGTDEQIKAAKEIIEGIIAKKREQDERKKVSPAAGRSNRRVLSPAHAHEFISEREIVVTAEDEKVDFNQKSDGTFEIYVSCVFDPNNFFIQMFNERSCTQLNRLTEEMTSYYRQAANLSSETPTKYKVGDIVAAPFDVDNQIYRAKVVDVLEIGLKICYVDFGDRRTLKPSDLLPMRPEFLRLRFQALLATLNMEVPEGGWKDEVIEEFCNLTRCGNWHVIIARRIEKLNGVEDEKLSLELYVKSKNKLVSIRERLTDFMHSLPSKSDTSPKQHLVNLEVNGSSTSPEESSSSESTQPTVKPAFSYAAATRKNSS